MTFRQGTEEYYKKFLELQEKLRKSEEERLKLEMKFNDMMQVTREEEQMYYRKLRSQYKQFLEENRKRQDRNERILRLLERIESRATMLEAKTQRFQLLRRQYQSFLKRICSQKLQAIKENDTKTLPKSVYKSNTHTDKYPNSVYQTERKEDILKKYLDEMESRNSITGNASTIADDIMNSIYSRKHFHKDDEYLSTVPSGSTLKPRIRFENAEPNMHDKNDTTMRKLDLQRPIDKYDSSSEDDLNEDKCYKGKDHRLINKPNDSERDEYKDKHNQEDSFPNFVEETKCDNVSFVGNAKPREYGDSKERNILKNDKFNESFDVLKAGVEKPFEKKVQYTLGNEETFLGTNPETVFDYQQKEVELEAYEKENSESSEKELKYDKDNINGLGNILPTGLPISKDLVNLGEKNEEEQIYGQKELYEGLDYDKNRKIIDKRESSIDYLENDQTKKNKERINNEENVDSQLDESTTEASLDNNYPNNTTSNEELMKGMVADGKGLKAEEILLVHEEESKPDVKAVIDEFVIEDKIPENNKELIVTSPEEIKPSTGLKSEDLELKSEEIHINEEVITYSNNVPKEAEEKRNDEVPDYLSKQKLKEPTSEAQEELLISGAQEETPISGAQEETPISGAQEERPISGAQEEAPISGVQEELTISGAQKEMSIDYDATMQPINYDENEQPILNELYDAQHVQYNQQDIQYDQNGHPIQYDEYGQPIHYDEHGQQIHYDENGQQLHFDEHGQQIHYDENGQQIHYDEHGQQIHYDENGQQIHYDEHGQQINYDENGQQIHYDEHGQQIHYDENGQQVQYDENGQQIQYDVNGQQIHYDENGQVLYDANGQQIHYDENGQEITYDENGQVVAYSLENERQLQYDETGQPIQYGDQFDSRGQQINYDENVNYNQQQLIGNSEINNEESPSNVLSGQEVNVDVSEEPVNYGQGDLGNSSILPDQKSEERYEVDQSEKATLESSQVAFPDAKDEKKTNVMDLLETDSESIKQDTKVSNDSDFDFSNN